jgi:hypothetical protein
MKRSPQEEIPKELRRWGVEHEKRAGDRDMRGVLKRIGVRGYWLTFLADAGVEEVRERQAGDGVKPGFLALSGVRGHKIRFRVVAGVQGKVVLEASIMVIEALRFTRVLHME